MLKGNFVINKVVLQRFLRLNILFAVSFVSLHGAENSAGSPVPVAEKRLWQCRSYEDFGIWSQRGLEKYEDAKAAKIWAQNKLEEVQAAKALEQAQKDALSPVASASSEASSAGAPVKSPESSSSDSKINNEPSVVPAVSSGDTKPAVAAAVSGFEDYYLVGGVAAAITVVIGAMYYMYGTPSWQQQVNKIIMQAERNPRGMLAELDALLEQWDGTAEQDKIIQYVMQNMRMTKDVEALLEQYK